MPHRNATRIVANHKEQRQRWKSTSGLIRIRYSTARVEKKQRRQEKVQHSSYCALSCPLRPLSPRAVPYPIGMNQLACKKVLLPYKEVTASHLHLFPVAACKTPVGFCYPFLIFSTLPFYLAFNVGAEMIFFSLGLPQVTDWA